MRIQSKHKVIMLTRPFAVRTRKKPANLSVDGALLEDAKRMKINLSQVFEAGLNAAICQRRRDEWLKNNRAALDAYNEHIEADGVFSEGLRAF